MMQEAILEGRQLECERDDRLLFRDLSVQVPAGALLQVEGPNGSGKTSLLRILAGLLHPQEGAVFWRGQPIKREREAYCRDLLYLGHRTGIKASLSPWENLKVWCALRAPVEPEKLRAALQRVGLKGYEDLPCHQLSAGQQRRAALARLFVSNASLWILDEAFTAIDRQGVAELEGWLIEKAAQGGAVILTTHHALTAEQGLQRLVLGAQS